MSLTSILNFFVTTTYSVHPYYLFCAMEIHHNTQKISYTPEKICNHFGSFLNNQCIDYFKREEEPIININDCVQYIERGQDTERIQTKWGPFVDYLSSYDKYYNSYSEVLNKVETFHDNLDYIYEHNKYGNSSYTLGINYFADMTNQEYISYISANKYDFSKDICTEQPSNSGNYPSAIDWRDNNAVTSVKDQGQCGSCWSFSTTGAVEGIYAITEGTLLSFSEQQLVDCSYSYGNHGCNGGLMQNAFTYISDYGITTEESYPYTATSSRSSCKEFEPVADISGCVNVSPNELQLTYAVAQQPVSVSIEADSRSFQLYSGGVYNDSSCGTTLDHGVLAVGYGTDTGKDYWIVKNSWSSSWGDAGYIKILRNSVATSTKGMCGIAMDASYPTM